MFILNARLGNGIVSLLVKNVCRQLIFNRREIDSPFSGRRIKEFVATFNPSQMAYTSVGC